MNKKAAQTQNDINYLIKERWSPRAFNTKSISQEALDKYLEAASWAPSSRNEQPWRYIYAFRGDKAFEKYMQCLVPQNREWAKHAAVIILSMAAKYYVRNGNQNSHYMHDTGAANTLLLLQAVEDGVYGHMMGGFEKEKTIETFNIPETIEPVCFMALGYPGDIDNLNDTLKKLELSSRSRKPLKEFAFKHKLS